MTSGTSSIGSDVGAGLRRLLGVRRSRHIEFARRCGWDYWPIAGYRDIPGWLTEGEALRLFDLARGLRPGAVAVELGSWLGRSSVVLGKALSSVRGATLYCVDPWNGDGEDYAQVEYAELAQRQPLPLDEQFRANLRRSRVERVVHPIRGYSADVGRTFNASVDLLFIDANHDYEAVHEDFRVWSRHLAPDAVVAFHDADHAGPRAVIDAYVQPPAWSMGEQVDSLYHARRLSASA